MSTEIFLSNGKTLDTSPDTRIAQTLQANNLENPEQVNNNYTNNFTIPATQTNREAFAFADEINSDSLIPYRKLDIRIKANGVEVVPFGEGFITEAGKNSFTLKVVSGNRNFFEALGKKSIRDVSLGEWDHDYTMSNVINSRGHHYGNGYVYDIINRGRVDQQVQSRWNDLYPSVFVRVLWDRIFENAGFTCEWVRGDDGLFEKLLIPASSPAKLDESFREAREVNATGNVARIGIANRGPGAGNQITDTFDIYYDKVSPEPFFQGEANLWNGQVYTSDAHMYVDVLASMGVKGLVGGGATNGRVEVRFELFKNGQIHTRLDKKFPAAANMQDFFLMDAQRIQMAPGDTLNLKCAVRRVTGVTNFRLELFIPDGQGLNIRVREDFPPGGRIRLNNWLPDISQKEFVKSIIFLYGLMMQTDAYTQTIRINPFGDLLNRIPQALDWSDKLTLDTPYTTTYRFGSFVQNNYIRYQGDPEEGENWADGVLVVDDLTLDEEKNIITLPYAATRTVAGVPVITMYEAQKKEAEDDPTEYDEVEALPRLLIRQDISMPYAYLDENDQPISLPDESRPISRFLPELHLGNWVVPKYYQAYQAILTRTRVQKVYLLLTAQDIANLDFATPVYLDYFKAYFYLNQIIQWEQGKACECELVKL